jgi:hypothetical protein
MQDFHPEFGYLAPSVRMMRTLRVVMICTGVGGVLGAGMMAALMKQPGSELAIAAPVADAASGSATGHLVRQAPTSENPPLRGAASMQASATSETTPILRAHPSGPVKKKKTAKRPRQQKRQVHEGNYAAAPPQPPGYYGLFNSPMPRYQNWGW